MKKMKGLLVGAAVIAVSLSASFVSLADWQQDETGWKYQLEDGTYAEDSLYEIYDENGNMAGYYFSADGYMKTGWIEVEGLWHYGNEDGKLACSEWKWIDGNHDGIYEKYLFYNYTLYSSMNEISPAARAMAETKNGVRIYETPDNLYVNESGARISSDGTVIQADEAGAKADPDLAMENIIYMSSEILMESED